MTRIIQYLSLVFLGFWSGILSAQQSSIDKDFSIQLELGFTMLGPSGQMENHMIENGFNKTTYNWICGCHIQHPKTDVLTPSIGLTLNRKLTSNRILGIGFNYNYLGEVSGSTENDLLFVSFSSFQVIPSYTFRMMNDSEWRFGIPLMSSQAKKTSRSGTDANYKSTNLGILLGYNFKISKTRFMTWRLGLDTTLTYNNNIGPYKAGIWDGSELPESSINFSSVNVNLIFEFLGNQEKLLKN